MFYHTIKKQILTIITCVALTLLYVNVALADEFDDEFAEEFVTSKAEVVPDPFQKFNKKMLQFNLFLDRTVINPVLTFYEGHVHENIRESLYNISETFVSTPVDFALSALEIKGEETLHTFWRFFINATFGIFGLFDAASAFGIKKTHKSFGETLAYYNVPRGPFIILPVLGPSTLREAGSIPLVSLSASVFLAQTLLSRETMLTYSWTKEGTFLYDNIGSNVVSDTVLSQIFIWNKLNEYRGVKKQMLDSAIDIYSSYKTMYLKNLTYREEIIQKEKKQKRVIYQKNEIFNHKHLEFDEDSVDFAVER